VLHRRLLPVLVLAAVVLGVAASGGAGATNRAVANGRILIESGQLHDEELVGLTPSGQSLEYGLYGDSFTAAFSPDGKRIAFAASDGTDHEIYVMNADGTGVHALTHNTSDDESPSWSPDGGRIAFTSLRDGDYDIYTMRADGTDVVNLTNAYWAGDDLNPHWSPDGQWITYDSTEWFGTRMVWAILAAGGAPVLISRGGDSAEWFDDWSPDGTHFLVESTVNGNWDLLQYETAKALGLGDVTSPLAFAETKSIENLGTYSPDGRKIAFSSNRSGSFQVYTMNVDGTGIHRLTNTPGVDNFVLAWQGLSDTRAPTAHAWATTVAPGARRALRFSAGDDSGRVLVRGYVFSGHDPVAYFHEVFAGRRAEEPRSFVWKTPKTLPRKLRFCVTAVDLSGNASARNCAPLRQAAA
jgi:TolB protein